MTFSQLMMGHHEFVTCSHYVSMTSTGKSLLKENLLMTNRPYLVVADDSMGLHWVITYDSVKVRGKV